MAFHTVAYQGSISMTLAPLTAVTDAVFASSGTTGFLLPSDLRLLAAYAGALTIKSARVNAPSLLRVGYCSIRPTQPTLLPPDNPNVMTLLDAPPLLRAGEPVVVESLNTASTIPTYSTLWFGDRIDPIPPGDSVWLHFQATGTAVVQKWTLQTLAFDQSIPSGTYAVVGFEYFNTTAVAARIVFPGSVFRPGVVAGSGAALGSTRTHRFFYDGSFGTFGYFQTFAPPNIEILCDAADTGGDGYLRVVRIGDIGAAPQCPPSTGPLNPTMRPGQ